MIINDVNRLKFTFSNGNKPNSNDLNSFNNIIKYINKERERDLNNHILFAKLIVNFLKNDIIKSKGNFKLSISSIKIILAMDLQSHLESFNNEINQVRLEKTIKDSNINLQDFNYPYWDQDQTNESLCNLINNLIDDYK